MSKLPILLQNMINKESEDSINFLLAEAVLKKIYRNEITDISVVSLAKECNVSKASVSRFCRNLGYEDYMDFKLDFLYVQRNMTKEKLPNTIYPDTGRAEIKKSYLKAVSNSINQLETNLGEKDLKKVARCIHDYKQVVLMGHLQSGFTALTMQQFLKTLGKTADVILNPTEQKEFFLKTTEETFVIVFSSGGYFFDSLIPNWNLQLNKNVLVCLITTNSEIRDITGVNILINCSTADHFAAGNLSIELAARLIVLYFKNYCS